MTRILLVDDHAEVRRAARAVLAGVIADLAVEEANSAASALALVAREAWDLVLLDLSLPDRGGLDTLREIRRLRPALPVVVMSFNPEVEYAAAARAAGAAAYVAKGSSSEVIASVIARALPLRG